MPIMIFSGVHAMPKKYSEQVYKQVRGHGVLFSLHKSYVAGARDWLLRNCELHDNEKNGDFRDTEIMFDSGAFTAWTKGEPSQTAEQLGEMYQKAARWCEKRFKNVWFITLDVMPGRPRPVRDQEGKVIMEAGATKEEVAAAVRQSDINHKILAGMLPGRILPVFHRGESYARLDEVSDMNPDYVCLSPLVRTPEKVRTDWSLRVMQRLRARHAGIQAHGLATTGANIMQTVDWRTVDSTAWIFNAAMGIIFLEYQGRFLRLPVSRFITQRRGQHQHIDSIKHPRLLATVERLCAERGFPLDVMRDDTAAREAVKQNIKYEPHKIDYLPELNDDPGYMARRLFNMQTIAEWSKRPYRPVGVQETLFEL
jgi:hypothetical protein